MTKRDSRFSEIVRRHLNTDSVANADPDEILAHFPGNVGQYFVGIGQRHSKHRSRQNLGHNSCYFDRLFFRHFFNAIPRRLFSADITASRFVGQADENESAFPIGKYRTADKVPQPNMKNQRWTGLLVGLLFLSALSCAALSYVFVRSTRKLASLQVNANTINQYKAAMQALAAEAIEYSKRNPEMEPILNEIGIRTRIPPDAKSK
jgi:hypothetical protein